MDDRSDDDDIVKVEMQDVFPAAKRPAEHGSNEHLNMTSSSSRHLTDASRGSHYDHVNSMVDQSAISVEQRAAAIMDRIKQLYYIDDDPERKEFLDDYFEFMRKRDATVTRIPTMAKQPLDLFKLYKTVVSLGGLTEVVRNRHWSKVTRELSLPSSITSAAFTLRTQYLRFLYGYECFQKGIEEQPWKLDDCEELSNSSFRATQASPSSFVDGRSCAQPRDIHSDQHHSPQWADDAMMCSSFGPRPPYSHAQPQINLPERGPIPNGFSHSMDMRCSEFGRQAPKMPHLTNGHAPESRGHIANMSNNVQSNYDCERTSSGYQSPVSINQSNSRRAEESKHSTPPKERPISREEQTATEINSKADMIEAVPASIANRPPDICIEQSAVQEPSMPVCTPSHSIHPLNDSRSNISHACHIMPGEINSHYCPSNKDDHQPIHDHSGGHVGRMPLHAAVPPNILQYPRSPYCSQRKRPRFYNPNGPPSGGCGCGRGEVLESSDPITFKVHYRTEQRVFVTVQFGKRMYLGELFAEDLE